MKKIISLLTVAVIAIPAVAQPMTYEQYNRLVAEQNVLYLAEKYNIDKATASLQASRVFNDPDLTLSYGNNQDWDIQMGQSVEMGLSINPDISGVRRARIAVAASEKEITDASVAAYLCNLRMEAAQAWAEAWRLRERCIVFEEVSNDMQQIAVVDSLRFNVGDIGRADALQSSLEAKTFAGELTTLYADYLNSLNILAIYCGGCPIDSMASNLNYNLFIPDENEICLLAESNRADLKAAMLARTLSENNLKLLKASRALEIGIDLGYSYNTEVRNEIAPAPRFNGLTFGVSIPLKFSGINRGEVVAARTDMLQSEKYYEAALLQVRSEAIQAYNSLKAAISVENQYTDSILKDARSIVQGRKEEYLKGESNLVEYLSAQNTYLDVMLSYIEACCNCFICKAKLEMAVGCPLDEGL